MEALKGQVALVTGGGRGIGRAIAFALAREGADVAVAARTSSEIEKVATEIRELGRRSLALKVDVGKEEEIIQMIQKTIEAFGKIDILVNNAGTAKGVPVAQTTTEDFDRTICVNLRGTFICCREALKYMMPRKTGAIINIASTSGPPALAGRQEALLGTGCLLCL